MGDLAAGLLPQLRARGLVMGAWVVGIGKLVQHPALALGHHLVGQVACVLHAAALGREHQLGAIGLHGLRTLDGQVLRHDQHHAVALDRRRHGQRDAGIARSRFDQRVARLDLAALFGAPDHGNGGPVLDRSSRVVALQLAQHHVAAYLVLLCPNALQRNQGRLADCVFDGQIRFHRP
ncbi:hypothetical protein D3C78_1423190 [compost metagenome]